ncbi:unnamed protein product, partial [marine sediment metagenome]
MRKLIIVVGLVVLGLLAKEVKAVEPVFWANFDGKLTVSGTSFTWKAGGEPVFQEGHSGKALLLGSDKYGVEYTGEFISDALMRAGSIVFWFKPTDWDPLVRKDRSIYPFFLSDAKGNQVFMYVMSYATGGGRIKNHLQLYVDTAGQGRKQKTSYLRKEDWGLNKWVQIAVTWDHSMGEAKIYINDKQTTTLAIPSQWSESAKESKVTPTLKIGGQICKQPLCHTLIDEVRVYGQVLDIEAVKS